MCIRTLSCHSSSVSIIAISVILLVLQYTIFSTYMLVFLFYLSLILSMLSVGEHALAIAALLSLGAIVLVAVLIVRAHSSVFDRPFVIRLRLIR